MSGSVSGMALATGSCLVLIIFQFMTEQLPAASAVPLTKPEQLPAASAVPLTRDANNHRQS